MSFQLPGLSISFLTIKERTRKDRERRHAGGRESDGERRRRCDAVCWFMVVLVGVIEGEKW